MGDFPNDLYYSSTHEWLEIEDNIATIGITHHAQHELGDVVFVELPEVDSDVRRGEEVAVVESVKTAADIFSPVSGKVIAINEQLADDPGLINQDSYGKGWLYKVEMTGKEELTEFLDKEGYCNQLKEA